MQESSILPSDKQLANKGDIFNNMFYMWKNKLITMMTVI